jgi:chorismate synthase
MREIDWAQVDQQPLLLSPIKVKLPGVLGKSISTASARAGNSVGAVIEVVAEGVPPGLGAPIYGKLSSRPRLGDDVASTR